MDRRVDLPVSGEVYCSSDRSGDLMQMDPKIPDSALVHYHSGQ